MHHENDRARQVYDLDKKLSCCCDSRSYCVRRTVKLQNVVRGQHDYLDQVIYSFERKSAFDACQFSRHSWLNENDTYYSNTV